MENFSTHLNNSEDIKVPEKISEPVSPEEQDEKDIFDTTEYDRKKQECNSRISDLINLKNAEEKSLGDIRDRLGIDKTTLNPEDVSRGIDDEINALKQEQIKLSANYPGDWALLLRERMLDPISKEKFVELKEASLPEMKTGTPGFLDKPKNFGTHYLSQIDNYDSNVERIFSSTGYGPANDYNKKPENLGTNVIGGSGVVFEGASVDGIELSARQKNIIESHEKGHGLRDFVTSSESSDLKTSVDFKILQDKEKETGTRFVNYLSTPEEIAERMSQLKNYFGFKASDIMTKEHLKYAKDYYVEDTGLDNGMSLLLSAVTKETEDKFLDTLNKYPI